MLAFFVLYHRLGGCADDACPGGFPSGDRCGDNPIARRREVGMDRSAWSQLQPWMAVCRAACVLASRPKRQADGIRVGLLVHQEVELGSRRLV
jgi:hypothetical protein